MLKIIRLLKASIGSLIIVIALLALQAYCDLALPSYTSDIVDIGIQQGGVTSAVPDVIRESQLKYLMYMLDNKEQETVQNSYKYISKEEVSPSEYEEYLKECPILAEENIYVLNTKDKETIGELEAIMARAFLIVSSLQTESEQMAELKQKLSEGLPAEMASLKVIDIITMLPKEQAEPIIASIEDTFSQMPETIVKQASLKAVKTEYELIGMDTASIQSDYIVRTGLKMLGLALIAMISTILVGYLSARIAAGLGKDARSQVFKKVVGFSNTEFDRFSTASLITRSTNDIQQIQTTLVFMIRIVFYAPILAIGGIIKALNTNISMSWVIGVAVFGILGLVGTLFTIAMPKFKLMQKLVDRLNLVTREILTGLSVIRAFSKEKQEEKRFDVANTELTRTNLFVNRVMTFMMPLMMFIMNGITVLIIWSGANGIDQGSMQVGDMMAFIQYTMQIIMSFLMLSIISIMLPRASVSANRIVEVLDTDLSIHDPDNTQSLLPAKKGYVEFENVSFRYPKAEDDVLSNISFTAKPGETTAIIGSTGSGKSTLVHLIPRFYDVTEGSIKVDGVDIRNVSQNDLRDKLGFVPQKGVLFSGTIDSNIRYGKQDATTEEILKAARIAQAEDFINEKEEKYDTAISQGGTNVSGGQKQRLSIARAIAKDPEIYIFDDSFSALDYKTDIKLRKALKDEIGDSTVIIVAQRINTIIHAEQILVLDEGKIVGMGTHEELLKNCEVYKQIALSQLSKEELAYE
ncbi:ABC transporter [Anaerocolumna cellulosilytica]|uniref:ABC transporter n=1 Tax=Anaerocolumna cellulosilytica TaxID=433286 RepID=A0A6S6R2J6_9FIRM|nr:ABC transporter ATP-binding protein [Anaerocolumna cellulosilytica]MBB5195990.1 ATP-binding cassette subfamily B protein [Anaerocolumna cellulosilytica]BCJ93712.1 ABC transporter [Anaerocolumna cellulosilytica]